LTTLPNSLISWLAALEYTLAFFVAVQKVQLEQGLLVFNIGVQNHFVLLLQGDYVFKFLLEVACDDVFVVFLVDVSPK
jgi:hypothetical protein